MQAGKFDTRVTFQEKRRVVNGGGGYSVEWRDHSERWAAVWPINQNKSDEEVSSRIVSALDYKLVVRADEDTKQVKSEWRIMIDEQPFAIQSLARPDRQRGTITMIIQEGQPT